MVKLLLDFIQFLYATAPLLSSLAVLTLLSVWLSRSIKRHAIIYYIVMSIPFLLVAIPFVGGLLGVETFSVNGVPFLGGILRDYIHFGTLGFPLLLIIMYVGALNPRNESVKKLLSIRKELSILSGFPVLAHSLIRVTHNFPNALRFFTDHEAYMSGARVTSALGAGISNFSFVLGVLMLALFLPLWITSFDSVHRHMNGVSWKKLQRWSYVLYAMLFIHAAGIQVGGTLNPRGGGRPPVEATATGSPATAVRDDGSAIQRRGGGRGQRDDAPRAIAGDTLAAIPAHSTSRDARQGQRDDSPRVVERAPAATAAPSGRGRQQSIGFADITVDAATKRYVHAASLLLVFGSYLYLRLRKAKRDAAKKRPRK
ncbi:MAG: ferric reductase-like transmembrane domain-containing protein [Odoribacteraceae bacterium]|jgi:DMSO/TMAO reductase YedYZ heme-binding membrane subunit|nr:ferric reductase-like transmembrane domain-containing protein [Odoribacteraceae bacterium]